MARYKDCDKCYHRYACAGDTDKWNYYGECPHYISAADVVPKSEVEEIFELFEELVDVQDSLLMEESLIYLPRKLAELKKKYTEEKNNK